MTTRGEYATAVLGGIGAPPNAENMVVMVAWARQENTTCGWNPYATTQTAPGSTKCNYVGVQQFPDFATGVAATVQTILNGYYDRLVAALRDGSLSAYDVVIEGSSSLDKWGSGGAAVYGLLDSTRANFADESAKPVSPGTTSGVNPGEPGVQPGYGPGPVGDVLNGAASVVDALGSAVITAANVVPKLAAAVLKVVKWLSDPHSWVRIGQVAGGVLLIALALVLASGDLGFRARPATVGAAAQEVAETAGEAVTA